jgi:hypothetical protein
MVEKPGCGYYAKYNAPGYNDFPERVYIDICPPDFELPMYLKNRDD